MLIDCWCYDEIVFYVVLCHQYPAVSILWFRLPCRQYAWNPRVPQWSWHVKILSYVNAFAIDRWLYAALPPLPSFQNHSTFLNSTTIEFVAVLILLTKRKVRKYISQWTFSRQWVWPTVLVWTYNYCIHFKAMAVEEWTTYSDGKIIAAGGLDEKKTGWLTLNTKPEETPQGAP